MSRIPDEELNRWKASADLLALMRADGMEFKRSGRDWVCLCPFHADTQPSLRVTQKTAAKPCDLWNCPACHTGGDPLQWLVKFRKLSFRAAVEFLRESTSGEVALSGSVGLPCPLTPEMSAAEMLAAVMAYYHGRLVDPATAGDAMAHLQKRGLADPSAIAHFGIGYADRSLGLRLPFRNQGKPGAVIRQKLAEIGLYRAETMKEHLAGCLTLPMRDPESGAIIKAYGRILHPNLKRFDGAKHLYLPGHHAGVLNPSGYEAAHAPACGHLILCESPLDAVTLWANGLKNVCSAWGTGGFTSDHLSALHLHQVKEVRIAFDRDEAGEIGARRVAEALRAEGICAYRSELPLGLDVNAYAMNFSDPQERAEALKQAIRAASFIHGQGAPSKATPAALPPATLPLAAPSAALPVHATACAREFALEHVADFSEVLAKFGVVGRERVYRVRGLHHNTGPERLKVQVKVWQAADAALMHADTLDLSQARARGAFVNEAAREIGESEGVIKGDLARLFGELEAMRDGMNADREKPKARLSAADAMPEAELEAALGLLRSPDLFARIVDDFALCGVVGEETNKLVGYLAATSRLLARPLAIVVQSSSAAGKSSLLDAILAMMPEEAQVRYSAMTGQSLYYMGGDSLKHKILAIAEEEGAEQASYSLKLLQSEGKLAIATPSKDAQGQIKTERYEVEGPCSIFLTTTSPDVDEELLNRCLVLTVDEDREQTRRIHHEQRKAETLEGLKAQVGKARLLKLHANAQRLLAPVKVVNPFAEGLSFHDGQTRARRDQPKYLAMIRTIALLHQFQRERKEHLDEKTGEIIPYIEATQADICAANRLMGEVLGRSLDELPPQSRRLLQIISAAIKRLAHEQQIKPWEVRFTRRDARRWTGWTDAQAKRHLQKLHDLEYLATARGPRCLGWSYELVYSEDEGKAQLLTFEPAPNGGQSPPTAAVGMGKEGGSHPLGTPIEPPLDGLGMAQEKAEITGENHPNSPNEAEGDNKGGTFCKVVGGVVVGQDQDQKTDPRARSFKAALLAAEPEQLKEKDAAGARTRSGAGAGAPESEAA